jgi:6-phosphofructokinase
LATRFGIAAIDAVHDGGAGSMVALQADKIVRVPLQEAVSAPKLVPHQFYEEVAKPLFG